MNISKVVYWFGAVASVITIYMFFTAPNSRDFMTGGSQNTGGNTNNVSSHAVSSGQNSSATSNVNINNNLSVINKSVYAEKNAVVIVGD